MDDSMRKDTTETEGDVLTLDAIDSITLPGDIDPNLCETEDNHRWRIADDACAEWALKKIKAERDELERITSLAELEISRLREQIEVAQRRYDQNTAFLTAMLERYFDTVEHKRTKTGTESYRLLSGQLVRKPAAAKMQPDDEKLVEWLRSAGREDMLKVETKPKWGELKKGLTIVGDVVMIDDTGEIVDGIDIVEAPAAFSVKF